MSDRFKYSENGICKIRNVPGTIATVDVPAEWLFYHNGFYGRMYLRLWPTEELVSPVVTFTQAATIPPKTPIFLNILSENPKFQNKYIMETIMKDGKPIIGPSLPISVVLYSKNGFLDENGSMSVEYGLHFDGLVDEEQGIWKFNVRRTIFDGESMKNMIRYASRPNFFFRFSHKQLILFHDSHSIIFNETHKTDILQVPEIFQNDNFENFLQIAHGVQLKFDVRELLEVIGIAHQYKVQNVLKYCERQLLMKISEFSEDDFLKAFPKKSHLGAYSTLIMCAAKFNLNQLLAFLLKYLFEVWVIENDFFERFNLEEMTNESLKMIVANLLYGEH